jgi:hypothetical protein
LAIFLGVDVGIRLIVETEIWNHDTVNMRNSMCGKAGWYQPSSPDSSFSLSSWIMSSSLETLDIKSSSVSMSLDAAVTGVGGTESRPAEARILLLGMEAEEELVASAAFRFRVVGGMVSTLCAVRVKHFPRDRTESQGIRSRDEGGVVKKGGKFHEIKPPLSSDGRVVSFVSHTEGGRQGKDARVDGGGRWAE